MKAKRILSVAVGLAAVLALLPVTSAGGKSSPPDWYRCQDGRDKAYDLWLNVGGQSATGHVAFPRKRPAGLAVFGHGYGHTSLSWVDHMREAARRGLIAVTMDYRGLQVIRDENGEVQGSRGWNAMAGAEDLIAAARFYQSLCKIRTVTILGVSMGANMTGLAVALAGERRLTSHDGSPLFDYWVDVEGATNVTETYLEARAVALSGNTFAKNAVQDIEAEMGGPIEQKPEEYRKRTVVARVGDLKASGIKGAIVIHGLDDGLVPYNQSREITALMREARIPTEMITIGRRDEDSERETTLTSYVGSQLDPDYTSPLAGHASEKSTTHIVMQTALERLWALMAGAPPVDGECVINGQTPDPARRVCTR